MGKAPSRTISNLHMPLTNDGEVDEGVAGAGELVVDPAAVQGRVLPHARLEGERRRPALGHEVGPVREHGPVRPAATGLHAVPQVVAGTREGGAGQSVILPAKLPGREGRRNGRYLMKNVDAVQNWQS